ncbi:piwi-like protein 2 isoform 1-T4 [Synchiropus picturatus]
MANFNWPGRGRGGLLPTEEPEPSPGRGRGLLGSAFIPPPRGVGDARFGRARGLFMQTEDSSVGRARGLYLPPPQPVMGVGRGAAQFSQGLPHSPAQEDEPGRELVTKRKNHLAPRQVDVPVPGHEPSLVSMFRGMGIESTMPSRGRGLLPDRRAAAEEPTGLKMEAAGPSGPPGEEEGARSSVLGHPPHRMMAGLGRAALPPLTTAVGHALLSARFRSEPPTPDPGLPTPVNIGTLNSDKVSPVSGLPLKPKVCAAPAPAHPHPHLSAPAPAHPHPPAPAPAPPHPHPSAPTPAHPHPPAPAPPHPHPSAPTPAHPHPPAPAPPHPHPSAPTPAHPHPPAPAPAPAPAAPEKMTSREVQCKSAFQGDSIVVASNHIPVICKNEAVYQYHVTFLPNVESMSMRFGMMKDHRDTTGEVVAFDGSILYLPVKLNDVVLKSVRRTDNQEVEIKVQLTKILPPNSDLCIPFYNVVLRRVMKTIGLKLVGHNHYDPQGAVIIEKQGMQVWPGYSTAIKPTEGGLYLCVDVTHKVLRNESVMDVMNQIYQNNRQSFKDECVKEFVGCIVITRYNNRTYRVDGIEWAKSPKDTFQLMDGSQISFVEYYKNNYGIQIKEMGQPLLLHRPKERSRPGGKQIITGEILLVPELSFMTGIPERMRKDFRAMKELTPHINVSGNQHNESIQQLLKNIQKSPESLTQLNGWGLGIGSQIAVINAKSLPQENICLKSSSFPIGPNASWSREVVREPSINTIPLSWWAIFFPRRCGKQAEELLSTFNKVGGCMGMRLEKPSCVELADDRTENYIKSIHSRLISEPNMQLVVCIMMGNRDDLYIAIKKLCCVRNPIPSQVINVRTISQQQKLRGIAQKILLQINCKLGGELWTVNVPLKSLMVVGVDVHHDTSKSHRSVMGFVASVNSSQTQWYSRVAFQGTSEELINSFRICLLAALQKHYEMNHNLPQKIVIYRDGVSDGQLKAVEEFEIPQLIKCFDKFPSYEPQMVFVVVQKRINTALYLGQHHDFAAPPPGTILDHTLTRKNWVDFFLMAHHIHQGCGLPTHYIVLYNTTNLTPLHLQRLTFKMCHLYWNWPGTIRVPAPCKYAHKLAFLAGEYLHSEPAIQLSDRLFFL